MTAPLAYKLGGPALEDPGLLEPLARELRSAGAPCLVVHGGGRQISRVLEALQVPAEFVGGRRQTSAAAMEVVEMVLSGPVNKAIAAGLTAHGVPALGLSARDGGLVRARPEVEGGRTGLPSSVDLAPVRAVWAGGFVPVIAPVSAGAGGEAMNVNADEVALALATAAQAARLVYFSDVDGVLADGQPLDRLTADEARKLIADGTIRGGMALKVEMALRAADGGVGAVVIAGKARLLGGFPGTSIVRG